VQRTTVAAAGAVKVFSQRRQSWKQPNRAVQVIVTVSTSGSSGSTWSPTTRGE
jgi:hypothetical protein